MEPILLSDYRLSLVEVTQIQETLGVAIVSPVNQIIPGSIIYVPGLGAYNLNSGNYIHDAMVGFYKLKNRIVLEYQEIGDNKGSYLLSRTAHVITSPHSVIPSE
jgi:hypothetical protein